MTKGGIQWGEIFHIYSTDIVIRMFFLNVVIVNNLFCIRYHIITNIFFIKKHCNDVYLYAT